MDWHEYTKNKLLKCFRKEKHNFRRAALSGDRSYLQKGQLKFLYAFVWEKALMVDYSETVDIYGIKVGIYSKLNEHMEIYITRGQGHSLTFVQGHTDFINFKQLLSWSHWTDRSQITSWTFISQGDPNSSKQLRSHDQDGHNAHKTFINLLLRNQMAENCYTALGTQVLLSLLKWWP